MYTQQEVILRICGCCQRHVVVSVRLATEQVQSSTLCQDFNNIFKQAEDKANDYMYYQHKEEDAAEAGHPVGISNGQRQQQE
jgi:hypothetical protein